MKYGSFALGLVRLLLKSLLLLCVVSSCGCDCLPGMADAADMNCTSTGKEGFLLCVACCEEEACLSCVRIGSV